MTQLDGFQESFRLSEIQERCLHCTHWEPDPQCKGKPQAQIRVCCKCNKVIT